MTVTIAIDDELVSAYEREQAVNPEVVRLSLEHAVRQYLQGLKSIHRMQDAEWALQSFAALPDADKAVIMAQLAQVAPPPSQQTGI